MVVSLPVRGVWSVSERRWSERSGRQRSVLPMEAVHCWHCVSVCVCVEGGGGGRGVSSVSNSETATCSCLREKQCSVT